MTAIHTRKYQASASEDDLLTAITDALTWYQWKWTHSRRSDKALTMGHQGVPDIIAARKGRVLFIELKAAKGELSEEQWAWLLEVPEESRRIWRPGDLDAALLELR